MDKKRFSKYFKAFGDPTRLRILELLKGGEMTVGQITDRIGLAQPTVSRHLGVLRDAGVVEDRREGQSVYYGLNREAVALCCVGFCDCLDVSPKLATKAKKS